MSTKPQVKTQAKSSTVPAAARITQLSVAVPENEAERPDITAQLDNAARLGHSLGAVGVDSSGLPTIQRQEVPEEEEEELQLKREPAAIQRQGIPEEEEEELQTKPAAGVQRQGGGEGFQLDDETASRINRARGGGQPLDNVVQAQMGASLGHDFSRVRVHTDAEADELNRRLSAKAFTTGADIFFKRGAYDPASSGSRELIAHELSHAVQQSTGRVSGAGTGMTVSPARHPLEHEADALARQVSLQLAATNMGPRALAAILALPSAFGKKPVQRLLPQTQPAPLVARVSGIVQRKRQLNDSESGAPIQPGSILLCPNPNESVSEWLEQHHMAGIGTHVSHTGFVGLNAEDIIESRAGGIKITPFDDYPPYSTQGDWLYYTPPPAVRQAAFLIAAGAALGEGFKYALVRATRARGHRPVQSTIWAPINRLRRAKATYCVQFVVDVYRVASWIISGREALVLPERPNVRDLQGAFEFRKATLTGTPEDEEEMRELLAELEEETAEETEMSAPW